MKQIIRLGMVIIVLNVSAALATSTFNVSCPEKYIATVTKIEDIDSSTAFQKVEVDFKIVQTLKGDKITSKKIQVVKDGPVKFKNGEVYALEANDIWLCSATIYSKL